MKFSNCWSKGCLYKTEVSSGVTDKHIYRKTCISLKCSNSSGKRDGHYFYCLLCNRHYPKRDKILCHLQSKKHKNRLSSENYFLENIGTSKIIDGSPKMLNDDMTTDSPNMYNDDPVQDDVTTFLCNEETECFSSENKSQQFFSGKILPDQFCPEILFPSLSTKNPKQCMVVNSYNNKVVNNSLEVTMDQFMKLFLSSYPKDLTSQTSLCEGCFDIDDAVHRSFFTAVFDAGDIPPFQKFVETVFSNVLPGNNKTNSSTNLSQNNAMFHLMLAKLVSVLPDTLRPVLVSLLYHYSTNPKLFVPVNESYLRSYWSGGNNSIVQKLPCPKAQSIGKTELNYVSLEDIIRFQFTTEHYPCPFQRFKDSIHANTIRGIELLSSAQSILHPVSDDYDIYPVKLILWSDGANPFSTKDCSVHICVATVGAPDGDHSGKWSNPLWIAPTKSDIILLLDNLIDEIIHLSKGNTKNGNPFYVIHQHLQKKVRVQVCLFTWICDRPEKAFITQSIEGRSNGFHLRYGYSIGYHSMSAITGKEWLVTCDKCCQKLLHQGRKFSLDSICRCGQCASFLNTKIQFHPSNSFP